MNIKLVLAAPLLAALALSGPAQLAAAPKKPSAAAKNQCFYARDVNNFAALDDQHVLVRVGVNDVYEFTLLGACPDVDWSMRLGLVAQGSDWICSGLDAEIVAPSPIGPQRCPVRTIRKLTPAEVAALPPRARP